MNSVDVGHMKRALREARRAARAGEVPVGCVVTSAAGEILGLGHNLTISRNDPTAHAEVVAIRRAARRIGNYRLSGTTLYVTLEPCLLCLGAIVNARIARIVYAAPDPKRGALAAAADRSVATLLHHRFRVTGRIMEAEAGALLRGFFAPRRVARPSPR
jgi:tRNA(adenine34) deaminase